MPKFRNENEPTINMIEQGNGIDKGRYLPGHSIDMIFCHPPNYNNSNGINLSNLQIGSIHYYKIPPGLSYTTGQQIIFGAYTSNNSYYFIGAVVSYNSSNSC